MYHRVLFVNRKENGTEKQHNRQKSRNKNEVYFYTLFFFETIKR